MSWKAEVKVRGDRGWYSNSLTFGTREEATLYSIDLFGRWTLVEETRVVESNDPVKYTFFNGTVKDAQ